LKLQKTIAKKKLPPYLKKICYLAPQAQGSIFFFTNRVANNSIRKKKGEFSRFSPLISAAQKKIRHYWPDLLN